MHMRCCKDVFSYCSQSDTKSGYTGKCPDKSGDRGEFCINLVPNSIENPLVWTEKERLKLAEQNDKKKTKKESKK